MNPSEEKRWRDERLDSILIAIAQDGELSAAFIFKGARILNIYLPETGRQSLDIDSNLSIEFQQLHPDRNQRAASLRDRIEKTLSVWFRRQDVVRFSLNYVKVEQKPGRGHPLGCNGLTVVISIKDLANPGEPTFPRLTMDIAAPELLTKNSTVTLEKFGGRISMYSLERIAGEKLRAYLMSLPTYVQKHDRPRDAVRVKDLFDIARILRARPLPQNVEFWTVAASEFEICCQARYVDCNGLDSFRENLDQAQFQYQNERVIPSDQIGFTEAWQATVTIIKYFQTVLEFPLINDIPSESNMDSPVNPSD